MSATANTNGILYADLTFQSSLKNQVNAIFGYGTTGGYTTKTNQVSNLGVVATDVTSSGTARYKLAATSYGGDKAIFGYGMNATNTRLSMTNLVSNTGVVATDTTGVGTARRDLAAAGFSLT